MRYIHRELEETVLSGFSPNDHKGLILAGIVGCGKTTLIEYCTRQLKNDFEIFHFTGDDTRFRAAVSDSTFLYNSVRSATQNPVLIFVDEVQKSELIFDALKYAFDKGGISFIVSGSNPQYLNTVAKKRLKRRAEFLTLHPFSIPEILQCDKLIPTSGTRAFQDLLLRSKTPQVPNLKITKTDEIQKAIDRYLVRGGLPLSHLAGSSARALKEIQKVVERGFEAIRHDTENVTDLVLIDLAQRHSQEFSYKNLFQKTGLRSRDQVNTIINSLIENGYLLAKKPVFPDEDRRSYLSTYSYVDPGIVTYLTGNVDISNDIGRRIEGLVHVRLQHHTMQHPLKSHIGYYKPYTIDVNNKVKFRDGEIDFIFKCGARLVPIEVKAGSDINNLNLRVLTEFVKESATPYGLVIYGGVPHCDATRRLVFWPYWLL